MTLGVPITDKNYLTQKDYFVFKIRKESHLDCKNKIINEMKGSLKTVELVGYRQPLHTYVLCIFRLLQALP